MLFVAALLAAVDLVEILLVQMVGLLLTDLPLAPLLNETAEETAVGPVQVWFR